MTNRSEDQNTDLVAIGLFVLLLILGWVNIYAAEYDAETAKSMFSLDTSAGKQLLWIGTSCALGFLIYLLDYRFFDSFSYIIYLIFIILSVAVIFFGTEVSGAKAWFDLGSFRFQPSEFTKYATLLAFAKYIADSNKKVLGTKQVLISSIIFFVPMVLTVLQKDTGTALVYGSLIIVLYREGMSPLVLLFFFSLVVLFVLTLLVPKAILLVIIIVVGLLVLGLIERTAQKVGWLFIIVVMAVGLVISVDFAMNRVFQPHQQKRIMSLLNPNADPLGVGWNVTQSKIAIGSGGFTGKGFLEGTQTKFDFVPEQTTDFIFCTVGEEHGWLGTVTVVAVFCVLLIRLINIAERQKSHFARIFGYGVVSVLFFHFLINIAMTIGLFPVIGIPLPFFSYGGSSLWAFSLMFFTFLKLDAHRMQVLQR
jgi:rod shape determining protein RodA